jgi:hypothetical protein
MRRWNMNIFVFVADIQNLYNYELPVHSNLRKTKKSVLFQMVAMPCKQNNPLQKR